MGAINCKTGARFAEETKSEADMESPAAEELRRVQSIFKSLTTRVLTARDELLRAGRQSFAFSAGQRNFDPLYAFLSDQLCRVSKVASSCSTVDTNKAADMHAAILEAKAKMGKGNRSGKENFASKRQLKRVIGVNFRAKSRSTAKRPNRDSNLYIETPVGQSLLSKGAQLRPVIPSTSKAVRSKPKDSGCPKEYRTCRKESALLGDTPSSSFKFRSCSENVSFDFVSLLPWNVQTLILSFLANQYRPCLCVSAAWHATFLSSLDAMFNPVENKLVTRAGEFFAFHNSYTQSQPCRTGCWKGVRVDRVLQLELLPGLEGKTLTLGYTYSFANDKKNVYRTQYRIDCVAKGTRALWIHNSENVVTGRKCTYTMNIMPVCTGDIAELAINYYTPRGLIDSASIEWEQIEVESTPQEQPIVRTSTVGTGRGETGRDPRFRETMPRQDLNRVCELEFTASDWYDTKYYEMTEALCDLREVGQHFAIEGIEFAALDIKACKLRLTAARPGHIAREAFGIGISISSAGTECVTEAKRLGLMIDRNGELQLRVGDTLVIYLSKHHQE